MLTDNAGERPIINRFAVDGSKVYGIGDVGVYRLDTRNRWKQISTDVPDEIVSLAITNDRLYSVVNRQGIFQHVRCRRTVNRNYPSDIIYIT